MESAFHAGFVFAGSQATSLIRVHSSAHDLRVHRRTNEPPAGYRSGVASNARPAMIDPLAVVSGHAMTNPSGPLGAIATSSRAPSSSLPTAAPGVPSGRNRRANVPPTEPRPNPFIHTTA